MRLWYFTRCGWDQLSVISSIFDSYDCPYTCVEPEHIWRATLSGLDSEDFVVLHCNDADGFSERDVLAALLLVVSFHDLEFAQNQVLVVAPDECMEVMADCMRLGIPFAEEGVGIVSGSLAALAIHKYLAQDYYLYGEEADEEDEEEESWLQAPEGYVIDDECDDKRIHERNRFSEKTLFDTLMERSEN